MRGNIFSSSFTVVAEVISASEKGGGCSVYSGRAVEGPRAHPQRVSALRPLSCYHHPETQHLSCVGGWTRLKGNSGPVHKGLTYMMSMCFTFWGIPLGQPG